MIVFIRSKEELKAIIQSNPFSKKDSNRIYVSFLNESKKNLDLTEIETVKIKGEELVIQNKEIYFFSPKGYGVSKLSNNFLEKKLNVSATTRNWKTVITLSELTDNLDRG
ncbi:PF08002 domain protein [Leptospira kirschneri str. 200801925]|nr:PF08002 domain protein [Leptospira kirschneri str. 200801925]